MGLVAVLVHAGREYRGHGFMNGFGWVLLLLTGVQISLGMMMKISKWRQRKLSSKAYDSSETKSWIMSLIGRVHVLISCLIPVLSWVEMGFGFITLFGFCHEDHLGQCLAHGIMGSAFIFYGLVLVIMLLAADQWLLRSGKSQEFYDSVTITAWGIVNSFTEHRWGSNWSHGDYQHTSMGLIWWGAGMVGIFLSKNWLGDGGYRRNHIPALVLIFTGWSMSQHAQHLPISTKVHGFFGIALMAVGVVRIIEISFILKDQPHDSQEYGRGIRSWQYLPPFLLVESGILFIGATEEQLQLLNDIGIDHGSYILTLSTAAFLIYLDFLFLVTLHRRLRDKRNAVLSGSSGTASGRYANRDDDVDVTNGSSRSQHESDIELTGLLSDDE
ncbi:hypothetical protein NADFUDRAFT_81526 [Nadsonia fulvescens var. elongata DSM 6958]|uniref:Protein YTP1-like C-terminal domain-containing protein n=1 Tax=Nadsonia fulvescens var. elongata DSM 6958 TaxID=857566 RepID=A0A1E3PT91_9ASCO|nr:hypothetical protein NADFUDRAFT_81526 [Nadsonia fulvescens var. elongata DSM 6958]